MLSIFFIPSFFQIFLKGVLLAFIFTSMEFPKEEQEILLGKLTRDIPHKYRQIIYAYSSPTPHSSFENLLEAVQ